MTGDVLTAAALNGEFNVLFNDYNGSINTVNLAILTGNITQTVSTNVFLLALTKSATGAGGIIDASDAGTGIMVDFQKTGIGTCLFLNQDAEALTISIDSEQTTTDIIDIAGTVLTTGNAIDLPDLDALTSGRALNIVSNSASVTARDLVRIVNDNVLATGATCLRIIGDAVAPALIVATN